MDCVIINQYFSLFKIHITLIIIFIILINLSYSAKGDSTNTSNDWNQFRNNPQHTGFQVQSGNEEITNYGIKWFKDFREGEVYNDIIYGEITVSDASPPPSSITSKRTPSSLYTQSSFLLRRILRNS